MRARCVTPAGGQILLAVVVVAWISSGCLVTGQWTINCKHAYERREILVRKSDCNSCSPALGASQLATLSVMSPFTGPARTIVNITLTIGGF